MELQPREEFNNWVHRFGIGSSILIFLLMMGFPLAVSVVYGLWPSFRDVWPGFAMALMLVAPYWPAETIGYMPVMGPGALYMSYITGNVTNLRMPSTVGTINILGLKPNSDECHTMAIIACGASVITTIVIVLLGVVIARPMAPLLQNPSLKPAFDYVIPALFGGLVAQGILKSRRDFLLYLPPLVINLYLCFFTKMNTAYSMLIGIASAVIVAVLLYRRGKKEEESTCQ